MSTEELELKVKFVTCDGVIWGAGWVLCLAWPCLTDHKVLTGVWLNTENLMET